MIDRGGHLNRQSHSELNRVEGVDLPRLPVLCDEVTSRLEVYIKDPDGGDFAVPDIGIKPQAKPVEVDIGDLSHPRLLRENG